MNSLLLVRRLHEHRNWVNRSLISVATELSQDNLREQLPIGQGSIWNSLLHLFAAEYVWLEALLGNEDPIVPGDLPDKLPGNQAGENTIESLDELAEHWTKLDRRWEEYLSNLEDRDLDQLVAKKSTSSRKGNVFRTKLRTCCCMFAHMLNTRRLKL